MIKKFFKSLLICVAKIILHLRTITRVDKNYQQKEINNILIYASMGIGDVILFTPTMNAIRKFFSKANITLLTNRNDSWIELLKNSKLVNKIILFERGFNPFKKIQLLKEIRKNNIDLLINGFWTDDFYLIIISVVCNIPFRAGYCRSDNWKSKYDFLYNIKINFGNEHEIDRGLKFIHALGIKESYINKKPLINIDEKDELFSQRVIKNNNLDEMDLIIGIHPGASLHQKWKRWDVDNFSKLSEMLIRNYDAKIIVFGSIDEIPLAESIKKYVNNNNNNNNNIIDVTGKTSIKEAAALIKRCNLFVCNDSGLMHISAAVETPVIAIYGPTDPRRTAPYGESHIIVRKDLPCSPCFKPGNSTIAENCPHGYACLKTIMVDEVFMIISNKISQLGKIK